MIYIIGVGGVGSWLTPAICLLADAKNVTLVDGDTLEEKNLNRQLFTEESVGLNKAEALARKYGCNFIPQFYSESLERHSQHDWLLVGVDNNPARSSALNAADIAGCQAIFGANETLSSEAYYYSPRWQGKHLDPRTYYPEIEKDSSDDPRRGAIGCTGEAQQANRQLVTANFMAASLMAHLYVVWAIEARKMPAEAFAHLPYKLVNNFSKNEYFKVGDKPKEQHVTTNS